MSSANDTFTYVSMTASEAKDRIAYLTEYLNFLNLRYYQDAVSEIPDYEFDQLLKELEALEGKFPQYKSQNSPTLRVGGTITKEFATIAHRYPMLSLSNTYAKEEIFDWVQRVYKGLHETEKSEGVSFVCEQKFDGVAISLWYENGVLVKALTRGDGIHGDDITNNARVIKSIPLVLRGSNYPQSFEVRGEVFFTWKDFDALNKEQLEKEEPLYANPRNTASGTLKLQDSSIVAKRNLNCYAYFVLGENLPFDNHFDALKALENWGFHVSKTYACVQSVEQIWEYIQTWEYHRESLPLATDGIVIKVNSFSQQQLLGITAKSPRWAISFKYKAATVQTQLLDVGFQVGRTGAITPVALMQPVQLAGTVVKRATLHNESEIQKLDLHIGDTVYVEKGGEIIPKITGVDFSKRMPGAQKVYFVTHCPECGTKLIKNPNEAAWYCPNEKKCPPQVLGRLEHFVHRKAMDIEGLGGGKLQILIEKGLVTTFADLYTLTYDQLLGLENIYTDPDTGEKRVVSFKDKTARNILDAIQKSKNQPFEKVLFALGIRYVGATVAEKLAGYFKNIQNIQSATLEDLMQAPEIGQKIAESIVQWFQQPENVALINALCSAGLSMHTEEKQVNQISNFLSNKTFVVTGTFAEYSREYLQDLIVAHGGKVLSGISSKLDFLLAGENAGPSKLDKAQKLGVQIIDRTTFLKMINAE